MQKFRSYQIGMTVFIITAMILTSIWIVPAQAQENNNPVQSIPKQNLRIHYEGAGENLGVWVWEDVELPSVEWPSGATPFTSEQQDAYGAYVDIPIKADATKVGFLIVDRTTGEKHGGDKILELNSTNVNEVWLKQGSEEVLLFEPVTLPEDVVRIHYSREDQNYSEYGLWLWEDVKAPSTDWPQGALPFNNEQIDEYGAYIDVPLTQDAMKIGFLIVNRNNGDEKDGGDKNFNLLQDYNQLWIKEGDDQVYVSPYGEMATGVTGATVIGEDRIELRFSRTEGLTPDAVSKELQIADREGSPVKVTDIQLTENNTAEITADLNLDKLPLTITYADTTIKAELHWSVIDELYAYKGNDLGATYSKRKVTFKLWAPSASSVKLNLYDKNDATQHIGSKELTVKKGVWSTIVRPDEFGVKDLKNYFYQYEVVNNGVSKKVLDPYAKSMAAFQVDTAGNAGPDGDVVGKAAIVDLNKTDPKGYNYAKIKGYKNREDAVIWELHVRDFTSDPSIEGDLTSRWGTYSALEDKLDYIKSLGVTHVQLLPVMAWYYGDETRMGERELDYSAGGNEYNWGYDPHHYFSPDGAYSEDAKNPELRVRELKNMIDAIHDAGMGVILDVVYTHMANADLLNDIVPNYYAWKDSNGAYVGGFGNNLATNHVMAEKLMVDSVKYWFDEYKIDGMRFDMMGDATSDSIQKAYDAAAELNPNALFIGEGWRTFSGANADPELAGQGADQDWMDETNDVGVFSDEIRNELKSGFGSEGEPRFLTGGARDINLIMSNIKGQPTNTAADDPGDMVQYIEAHDNLPLYDVIAQSIKKDPSIPKNDLEIHKRIRLGNLMVLTSQGTAFLHAGQEYGRTKQWHGEGLPEQKYHALSDEAGEVFGYFIHDSYDASDAINMFDWSKALDSKQYPVNSVTREYTEGLIELRKSTNAFRLGEESLVNKNVTLIEAPEIKSEDLVIAYKNQSTDNTGTYYVFVNADQTARTLSLNTDLTKGTVVVDQDEAGVKAVSDKSGFKLTKSSITLEQLTAVVIKMKENPRK